MIDRNLLAVGTTASGRPGIAHQRDRQRDAAGGRTTATAGHCQKLSR